MKRVFYSFLYAFRGLYAGFEKQINIWIHLIATAIVVFLGFWLKIRRVDWALVILAISAVFVTELLNTSIEKLTDLVAPDFSERAAKVKDIAAAAVLVAAIVSAIVGCIVFFPKISQRMSLR